MTQKNDQDLGRIYKICPDQYQRLIDEIHTSRALNTEEHDTIRKIAGESAELAEKIQKFSDMVSNVWTAIMFLRNVTFTVGFVIAMAYFITTLSEKAGWM